jgi:hypothetical protein
MAKHLARSHPISKTELARESTHHVPAAASVPLLQATTEVCRPGKNGGLPDYHSTLAPPNGRLVAGSLAEENTGIYRMAMSLDMSAIRWTCDGLHLDRR